MLLLVVFSLVPLLLSLFGIATAVGSYFRWNWAIKHVTAVLKFGDIVSMTTLDAALFPNMSVSSWMAIEGLEEAWFMH